MAYFLSVPLWLLWFQFESLVDAFGSKKKKSTFEKKYRNQMDNQTIEKVMAADARQGSQLQKDRQEKGGWKRGLILN